MSKVLVDRELLERACMRPGRESLAVNDRDIIERGRAQAEIRELLAQPAEADGVEVPVVAYQSRESGAVYEHDYGLHRPLALVLQDDHLAALSAVTAERDALRQDLKNVFDTDLKMAALREQEGEIKQLRAEVEALRPFANEIVSGALDGGSFDGGDIQEMAVQHGLLRSEQREESCGDACGCSEFGFPSECFRKTELLRDAAMAAKEGQP